MNLNELKRQMLQERLDMLIEQYKAAHRQFNSALSATDRMTLDRMIRQLEQDIGEVEAEFAALGNDTSPASGGISPSTTASGGPVWKQIGIEMIRIPAGEFLYGDDKQTVYLDEFSIARTPVTNRQYEALVNATGYKRPKHWEVRRVHANLMNHPVVYVSWHDAQAFCEWAGVFLPTEHQWEKAARGTDGRTYPWGDEWMNERLCNYGKNVGTTTPVGRYSPQGDSPYGLVDMAGNVREWCDDWYDERTRVVRGGSWPDIVRFVGCAYRTSWNPGDRLSFNGFRVLSLGI